MPSTIRMSLSNVRRMAHKSAQIGRVKFDSVNGLGAHDDNQHVMDRGFLALMRPADFLYVVNKIRKERTHEDSGTSHMSFIQKHLRDGGSIGAPRIYLEVTEDRIKVISHEGRHRATNIMRIQPNKDIMVHVIVRKSTLGKGRKGITRDLIQNINWMIEPQDKYDKKQMRPVFMFRHAFWINENNQIEKVI